MSRSAGIHGASRGRWTSRLLAMLFFLAAGTVVFGGLVVAVMVVLLSEDLPDHSVLIAYEPPVLTRVHAADGAVIGVFAREHRVFTPIGEIPEMVRQAFISAEDKNFYLHAGIDLAGVAKAVVRNVYNLVVGRRLQGASTITQQVAKNMLLTREKTLARKIREGILAVRLGEALSKDRILELYLNEIFLGRVPTGSRRQRWRISENRSTVSNCMRPPISPVCPRGRTTTIRSAIPNGPWRAVPMC